MRQTTFYLLTTLCALALSAQTTNRDQTTNPSPQSMDLLNEAPIIEFSVYVWPQNRVALSSQSGTSGIGRAFYDAPSGMQQLYLRRGESTTLHTYQGEGPLIIYNYIDRIIPVPEGAPPGTEPTRQRTRIPIAKVELPDDLARVMIILVPGRKNSDGTYLTAVMPYETEGFEPGMARVHNNTKRPLALVFPKEKSEVLKLKPNGSITFSPSDLIEQKNPRVIVYGVSGNNKLSALHTSRLYIEEDATNLFLVFPQGHRVRLLRLGGHENTQSNETSATSIGQAP